MGVPPTPTACCDVLGLLRVRSSPAAASSGFLFSKCACYDRYAHLLNMHSTRRLTSAPGVCLPACLPACSQCVHSRLAAVARHKQAKQKVGGRPAPCSLHTGCASSKPARRNYVRAQRAPAAATTHPTLTLIRSSALTQHTFYKSVCYTHECFACCSVLVQAGQAAVGSPLGLASAAAGLSSTPLRRELMSDPEAAAWLSDLAGSCPLAQLASRGIPTSIDRCDQQQQQQLFLTTAGRATAVAQTSRSGRRSRMSRASTLCPCFCSCSSRV